MIRLFALALIVLLGSLTPAGAQARPQTPPPTRPPAKPQPPARATTSVRAFGDLGFTTFTATDSFEATLGSAAGVVFGGGAEVVLPQRFFFGVRVSRFTAEGERVFVHNGETFPLGIPLTVTITPVLVSGGFRFGGVRANLRPYVGGGAGWHRYTETSDFAASGEDVNENFQGYHLFGGAEYRLSRLMGVAGEVEWATVPDAIGGNPTSVAGAFGEDDLGGVTVRVKVVLGR